MGVALGVVASVLVVAASATAAGPATVTTTTVTYTVGGSAVPGASTGVVLDASTTATVTATGAVCPYGNSFCPGPNGDTSWNTTSSSYGSFPLPGGPAWGLVGRVGGGAWVQVGTGPTTLTGTGVLEFAVNDDLLSDNTGSFTVTVTYSRSGRKGGSGSGDCKPGWGYGDENHEHCGPPGQVAQQEASPAGTSGGNASAEKGNGNGNANGHAKR
jgi:hypothetical protein